MPYFRPQIINLDWLSFSGKMPLTDIERATEPAMYSPPAHTLQHMTGTNIFKDRWLLFNEGGDKVATLLTRPHSKIIDSNTLYMEIANKWLYTGYSHIPAIMQQAHEYCYSNLSRVDICCDFNPNRQQREIIDALQAGRAYVQGKREGSMFHRYDRQKRVERVPKCMNWGQPATQIKWKLYDKTLEIHPTDSNGRTWCSKPYIETMWRENGLDPKNVWRLEVSMMTASTLEWNNRHLTWEDITTPQTLYALFYDLYSTRFVIRANEGHENKRYDKILPFLDIRGGDSQRIHKAPATEARTATDHVATIRALVRELERPETKASRAVAMPLLDALAAIASNTKLTAYLTACIDMPFDEYCTQYLDNFC